MKIIIWVVVILLILAGLWYFFDDPQSGQQMTVYTSSDFGVEFKYSDEDYVLKEEKIEDSDVLGYVTLFPKKEYEELMQSELPMEGSVSINMHAFPNPSQLDSREWLKINKNYVNSDLIVSDVADIKIDGLPAIQFMSDGLYTSDNIVLTKEDRIYLISGSFVDIDSQIRQDFESFLNSFRFVKIDKSTSNQAAYKDLVRVTYPLPGSTVQSPFKIVGEARGYWFFEASFPVYITNWDGLIIGSGIAQAQSEWMVEDFVPFEANLEFTLDPGSYSNRAILILQKDNPSDMPEFDDAFEFPLYILTNNEQVFCTQEAKTCPDGSYVGRVGPNCEFEACLGE
jgi:hypothetical protein